MTLSICGSLLSGLSAAEKVSINYDRIPDDAVKALSTGTEYILYSLDPNDLFDLKASWPRDPRGRLHDFKVLGGVRLTDSDNSLSTALIAVHSAIRAADRRYLSMCFNARHALRVIADGKTYDFMICYECHQIKLYRDGTECARIGIPGTPDVLNNLLTAARIPLAKPTSFETDEQKSNTPPPSTPRSAVPNK